VHDRRRYRKQNQTSCLDVGLAVYSGDKVDTWFQCVLNLSSLVKQKSCERQKNDENGNDPSHTSIIGLSRRLYPLQSDYRRGLYRHNPRGYHASSGIRPMCSPSASTRSTRYANRMEFVAWWTRRSQAQWYLAHSAAPFCAVPPSQQEGN
jgi:hypothetical protein